MALDPKLNAEMDQSREIIAEVLPSLWKGIYDGCVKEGFTESQALRLLEAYIQVSCSTWG